MVINLLRFCESAWHLSDRQPSLPRTCSGAQGQKQHHASFFLIPASFFCPREFIELSWWLSGTNQ